MAHFKQHILYLTSIILMRPQVHARIHCSIQINTCSHTTISFLHTQTRTHARTLTRTHARTAYFTALSAISCISTNYEVAETSSLYAIMHELNKLCMHSANCALTQPGWKPVVFSPLQYTAKWIWSVSPRLGMCSWNVLCSNLAEHFPLDSFGA